MESANPVDQLGKLCGKARKVSVAKAADVKPCVLCLSNSPDLTRGDHAQSTPQKRDRKACINKGYTWITLQQQATGRHDLHHSQRQPSHLGTVSTGPEIRDQTSVRIKYLYRSLFTAGAEEDRFTSIRTCWEHESPDLVAQLWKVAQW